MSFAPPEWTDWLIRRFSDASNPAYGQVATTDGALPKVRTVHFQYEAGNYKTLIFNTALSSPKWRHLKENHLLAGCFFESEHLIQFRWEGYAKLVTLDLDAALVTKSWNSIREDLKRLYWERESVCPNFGVVVCLPETWDIYEMNENDYALSKRAQFHFGSSGWTKTARSIVD
jgi:general stress protein 26